MQRTHKSDNIRPESGGRYEAFLSVLDKAGADALLVTDLGNVRYVCGFTGSAGILLITRDRSLFLTDGRYREQACLEVRGAEVLVYRDRLDFLEKTAGEINLKSLCFESRNITHFEWKGMAERLNGIELIPLKDETARVRSLKDKSEVDSLRRGAGIARESFESVLHMVKPGNRERDIAVALEYEMRKRGAEKVSFDIIVASGENSALPHAKPGEKEVEEGDMVVLDFGVVVDGYSTDETCTIKVGDVGKEMETVHRIVLDAHDRAIDKVRPGVVASEIDGAARGCIKENGYGEYFRHGTGHGVGLEVHELPVINDKSRTVLEEGMVFTVEPGIYLPGVGGVRIEDMVLVTKDGAEIITGCNNYLRG